MLVTCFFLPLTSKSPVSSSVIYKGLERTHHPRAMKLNDWFTGHRILQNYISWTLLCLSEYNEHVCGLLRMNLFYFRSSCIVTAKSWKVLPVGLTIPGSTEKDSDWKF